MNEIGETGFYNWSTVTSGSDLLGVYTVDVSANIGESSTVFDATDFRVCSYFASGSNDGIINDC